MAGTYAFVVLEEHVIRFRADGAMGADPVRGQKTADALGAFVLRLVERGVRTIEVRDDRRGCDVAL